VAFGWKRRRRVTFQEGFARGGEGVPETTRNDANYFISRVVAAAWYSVVGEPVPREAPAIDPEEESSSE
jgi:hypothetical protein